LSQQPHSLSELVRRGQERYEREVRSQVEAYKGKMLALDVDSGQYALADDSLSALDQLKAKVPEASVYLVRIGYPTAVQIGCAARS
jgi:hypothetical protein